MLPVHADLPLVSIEVKARFDVVVRADGSAKRAAFKTIVGVPFAENGEFEHDSAFDMRDDRRNAILNYVRTGSGVFALRHGLSRWEKRFASLEDEALVVAEEWSIGWRLKKFGLEPGERHALTGRVCNSYNTNSHGTLGEADLDRRFDLKAVPERLAQIRRVYADNIVLTPLGIAYRLPYPSWDVSSDGRRIELESPTGSGVGMGSFGLDRLEDAIEFGRRLSGGVEPQVHGGVLDRPRHIPPDGTAAEAACILAQTVSSSLGPRLADLAADDVGLWHDCANAEEIVRSGDPEAVRRILSACRDLAQGHVGQEGMKGLWKWNAMAVARVALELGADAPTEAPRP